MKISHAIKLWPLTATLMLLLHATAHAQTTVPLPPGVTTTQSPVIPDVAEPSPELPADLVRRQAKLINDNRQKQLTLDTQKLLTLANELKAAVDKSDKGTLSVEVVRKAEEIEKLAHDVKEKMKGS